NHARAYTISGENISAAGWEMRMGGWGVFVMNPAGIDLAGDFSGNHAPQNAVMLFGDYNIKGQHRDGSEKQIKMHFESAEPTVFDRFGSGLLNFKLHSEAFGDGLGQGVQSIALDSELRIQQDARNILIFPDTLSADNLTKD
ncbi:MAG: hypothetical protein ACI9FJ_002182, partial [Alteromonadaceae bacterium]